ncbi:winged helix-turn-helix transcriptional regulator [Microaceticoccus formicicus]
MITEVPPRVEYCLTELGQSLLPVIESLRIWGIEYKKSINQ